MEDFREPNQNSFAKNKSRGSDRFGKIMAIIAVLLVTIVITSPYFN